MGRQQSMHLFNPKMSRQLSVVDLIQQYLPTRRWYHQSRLLLWAFKDKFKAVLGYNMKLSMIPTSSASQLPHFRVWRIPRGLIHTCQERWFHNQQRNKGLDMISNSNNTRISILTTSWMVISHPKCWTINWKVDTNKLESLNWHLKTARGFPNTSGYLATCVHRQYIHVEPRAS